LASTRNSKVLMGGGKKGGKGEGRIIRGKGDSVREWMGMVDTYNEEVKGGERGGL